MRKLMLGLEHKRVSFPPAASPVEIRRFYLLSRLSLRGAFSCLLINLM